MTGTAVSRIAGLTAIGGAIACAWVGSAIGAAKVPDPCTLVPAAKVLSTTGVKVAGKLSTRPDGPVKQSLCTFKQGDIQLQIGLAPHQVSGGFGGPPGMVIAHPSGIGGGTFAYGTNAKFLFANASFTKSNLDVDVYDNGKLPRDKVLALARIVFASLT